MEMNRVWAMPNAETFTVPPIAEFEDSDLCIKHIAHSLRKSIEKRGLRSFLKKHPKLKTRPLWQRYIQLTTPP